MAARIQCSELSGVVFANSVHPYASTHASQGKFIEFCGDVQQAVEVSGDS